MTTTRRTPNPEDFWKFTDEEMETAKGTDLPDLLEHLVDKATDDLGGDASLLKIGKHPPLICMGDG